MSGLESFLSEILLLINPDPAFWFGIFLIVFLGAILLTKTPGTSAAHFSFILAWALAGAYGAFFEIIRILLIIATAIMLVLALWKLGNR